jgi:predicted nuclease of predicted toxin-antitoxin system
MNSKPADQFQFLVDVNLPKKFQFFHSNRFIHVVDIDPSMKDKEIWEYALFKRVGYTYKRHRFL